MSNERQIDLGDFPSVGNLMMMFGEDMADIQFCVNLMLCAMAGMKLNGAIIDNDLLDQVNSSSEILVAFVEKGASDVH